MSTRSVAPKVERRERSRGLVCLAAAALLSLWATDARAQPFGPYLLLDGDSGNYIEIPHDPALNPTDAMTLEGWVRFDAFDCESLIGKNFLEAFWVGPCSLFRSYTRGSGSSTDGGAFAIGDWTHWAVTSDGATRRHYLNGSLVHEVAEAGPLTTSTDPVRIGSDVSWEFTPEAALDEFRLWNVARTEAQIQSTMNTAIKTPMPGLVAVWSMDGSARGALGTHHGEVVGSPAFAVDGTIDPSSPKMPVVFIVTPNCGGQGATPVGYDVVPFVVESDGNHTVSLTSTGDFASFYIYEEAFDPEDALTNCLAAANAGTPKAVTVALDAGVQYLAVVINDQIVQDGTIDYELAVSGPGPVRFLALVRYDFAEGATGFFTTAIGVFNPSRSDPVSVDVTLLPDSLAPIAIAFDLDPLTRRSIDVNAEVGVPAGVAAVVRANGPVAAIRQVHWDDTVFGSTLESGAAGPSTVHYFAEGATSVWDLFYLFSNDSPDDAEVTVQYLPLAGPPIDQQITVPAHTRRTVWANAVPGMEDNQAGAIVTSDVPIAAERAMYLTGTGAAWRAGAVSRGAHALSQTWFFAECATSFFDCFLLLANPDDAAVANVQAVYQLPSGQTVTKNYVVPASQRRTILVEAEDAALVDTTAAISVVSDLPIVAERAMWWGPDARFWYESNATLGSTEAGTVWGVGEAWTGGAADESAFVLVSNVGDDPAEVRLTVIYDNGASESEDYTIPGDGRATFFIGGEFPGTEGNRFSVLVESLGGESAMPIIVDVSRYQSTAGRFGNAGGSTTATRIR